MNPILSHFLGKVWSVDALALRSFAGVLAGAKALDENRGPLSSSSRRSTLSIDGKGVARIEISGILMAGVPRIVRWFGLDATAYEDIRSDLADALGDERTKSVQFLIDSPGGQVNGARETADAIAEASKRIPTATRAGSVMASAAYWLGAQARRIDAGPTSVLGSIGVYSTISDTSGLAEQLGVRVHLLRSGPFKGTGTPGVPVAPAELEPLQRIVDDIASLFKADVARGRGVSGERVEDWSTGEAWLAGRALQLGLIDAVTVLSFAVSSRGPAAKARSPIGPPCYDCRKPTGSTDRRVCPKCNEFRAGSERRRVAAEASEIARRTAAQEAERRESPCAKCSGPSELIEALDQAREVRRCARCGDFTTFNKAARDRLAAGATVREVMTR